VRSAVGRELRSGHLAIAAGGNECSYSFSHAGALGKGDPYAGDAGHTPSFITAGPHRPEDDWQADAATDRSSALGALICGANKLAVSARSAGSKHIAWCRAAWTRASMCG